MRTFAVVFLSIYSVMNLYVFRKLYLIWPGHRGYLCGLVAAALLLAVAPILVRVFDHAAEGGLGPLLTAVGNSWLALLFWLFCAGLALDGWSLAMKLLALAAPAAGRWALPSRTAALASLAAVAVVAFYSLHEASNVRLKEVHLKTSRLPAGSAPVRILQISDMHLSLTMGERMLRKVVSLAERAQPDLIAMTGDAVDMPFAQSRALAPLLAGVKAPLGKFAVTGNHEHYGGVQNGLAFLSAAGFVTLRGEGREAGEHLFVAGVDDPALARRDGGRLVPEEDALPQRSGGRFVLFLKHQPNVRDDLTGRFDLQLSGHSHGGQIFPFTIIVRLYHRYGPGLHELAGGARLYVSRGTGSWGPPMRFLSPPEITLIVLEPG